MKLKKLNVIAALLLAMSLPSQAQQNVSIDVNLDVKHRVGDVEKFDRSKFVTIHSTINQPNWAQRNVGDRDMRVDFLDRYDVYCGRATGGITSTLRRVKEDPTRPGFADPADIKRLGALDRAAYARRSGEYEKYESRSNKILCTQHYLYPTGELLNKKPGVRSWALSTTDSADEPFGTAAGEFYAHYLREFFGNGGKSGEPKPKFCEITNEPLWPLVDWTQGKEKEDLTRIFRFHATVAREIKKLNPDMPIGGYCTAFPDFDSNNFERWNQRWKHFIDIAGKDMDFWTIHLYDFPCIGSKQKYRKGSNMEATMDMLEQYSYMTLGEVKPLMVSEYGAQTHNYNRKPYTPYASWLKVKSEIAMVMQFMERANNINMTLPYHMLKMEWNKAPGSARLMMRDNEPESYTGAYRFTDNVKFYQMLADINGVRVDTKSSNVDVMCDGYVDGDTAYILVSSLSMESAKFDLNIFGASRAPKRVTARRFYLKGGKDGLPQLDEYEVKDITATQELDAESTYLFIIKYGKSLKINQLNEESKYYATSYLQPITGNKSITFEINGVKCAKRGEAVLRLGLGRDHGKVLQPKVVVNGHNIEVPKNFRGDEQRQRDNFFGVLEIPLSVEQLKESNKIEVTLPDDGGYISTCTMQYFAFSDDIRDRK